MLITKDITFELVTPAFSGQADGDPAYPEGFSGRCLKPLLRYWWRTMHPVDASVLRKKEAEVFGSMGDEGQRFTVRPKPSTNSHTKANTEIQNNALGGLDPLIMYLGYGVISRKTRFVGRPPNQRKVPYRIIEAPMYHEGNTYSFTLGYDVARQEEIEAAVWLFSVFGGWGRRSRRGFGSLRVNKEFFTRFPALEADTAEEAHKKLKEGFALARALALKSVGGANPALPERPRHTAFCDGMRVLTAPEFKQNSMEALQYLARGFYAYRRHLGKDMRTGTCGSDHNERDRLARATAAPNPPPRSLKATQFGLPLNARMSYRRPQNHHVDVNCSTERRGSPLFLTVVKFGDRKLLPVIAYFPAVFLPKPNDITVKVWHEDNYRRPVSVWSKTSLNNGDDTSVRDFLDRLRNGNAGGVSNFPTDKWEVIA